MLRVGWQCTLSRQITFKNLFTFGKWRVCGEARSGPSHASTWTVLSQLVSHKGIFLNPKSVSLSLRTHGRCSPMLFVDAVLAAPLPLSSPSFAHTFPCHHFLTGFRFQLPFTSPISVQYRLFSLLLNPGVEPEVLWTLCELEQLGAVMLFRLLGNCLSSSCLIGCKQYLIENYTHQFAYGAPAILGFDGLVILGVPCSVFPELFLSVKSWCLSQFLVSPFTFSVSWVLRAAQVKALSLLPFSPHSPACRHFRRRLLNSPLVSNRFVF